MVRRTLVVLIVALLSSTARGAADDTLYEFKQHLKDGQECAFLLSDSFTMSAELKANGIVLNRVMRDEATQSKGRIKVLQSENGAPTAEEVEIDKTSGWISQKNGEPVKQQAFLLSGKTVTVRRDPFGGVSCEVDGARDPKVTRVLRAWFNRDTDFYPDHPVRVGDKWEVSSKLHRHLGTLTVDDRMVAVSQLVSVHRSAHGHLLARVNVSSAMISQDKSGMLVDGTLEGQVQIDLGSGRVLRFDLAGALAVSGTMDVIDRNGQHHLCAISGDGKIEAHQLCKPLASVATTQPASNPEAAAGSATAN